MLRMDVYDTETCLCIECRVHLHRKCTGSQRIALCVEHRTVCKQLAKMTEGRQRERGKSFIAHISKQVTSMASSGGCVHLHTAL